MEKESVCVLCGEPWVPAIKNRCECGGFCTWGPAKGAQPSSWNPDGSPKPPPQDVMDSAWSSEATRRMITEEPW